MKKGKYLYICLVPLLLTACTSGIANKDLDLIRKVDENVSYDKEMDALIKSVEVDDTDKAKVDIEVSKNKIDKLLSNYKPTNKDIKLPTFVYINQDFTNSPYASNIENKIGSVDYLGNKWEVFEVKNVDGVITTSMLSTKVNKNGLTLEELEDKIIDITNRVLEEYGRPIYSVNANIDIKRDNRRLKSLIDKLDTEEEKEVDYFTIQKGLEENRANFIFEGKDFYIDYIIYNNPSTEFVELGINYVSRTEPHFKDGFYDLIVTEVEDALTKTKGKSDLKKSYAEYNGRIINYGGEKKIDKQEEDLLKYTLAGMDDEDSPSNDKFGERKTSKEWVEEEFNNRKKMEELKDKGLRGGESE